MFGPFTPDKREPSARVRINHAGRTRATLRVRILASAEQVAGQRAVDFPATTGRPRMRNNEVSGCENSSPSELSSETGRAKSLGSASARKRPQ